MKIVIALGGNALGNDPTNQQELINVAIKNIIPLIKDGHQIILNHGNGPQVGIINLAFEDSYENADIPYMPFPECTAMSQGYIGYHLQKNLKNALIEEGINRKVVSLITQVAVDETDESFKNPTKPVGPFYTKEMADELAKKSNEVYIEDSGRGYRKVVSSPKPIEIIEMDTIKELVDTNHIVIAGGGGGIPVLKQNKTKGANAVIDKDLVASMMAEKLRADMLIILTNIKQAKISFGKSNEEAIGEISINKLNEYIKEEHFAKGSMLPKINAAIKFTCRTGNNSIITSLDNLENALKGIEATIIKEK